MEAKGARAGIGDERIRQPLQREARKMPDASFTDRVFPYDSKGVADGYAL